MANQNDKKQAEAGETLSGLGLARRRLLRHAAWVAPTVLGTATVRARAQAGSCNPNCAPQAPCSPITD
jgi:hypothetical protein